MSGLNCVLCCVLAFFSPTGLNILAQGKAKRRPGYATARNAHCPEGAEQTVATHVSDLNEFCPFRAISRWGTPFPGRRSALPWARLLLPHSGRIAKALRIAGIKSQGDPLLKNGQAGLCRTAQAEPAIHWIPRQSLGTSWCVLRGYSSTRRSRIILFRLACCLSVAFENVAMPTRQFDSYRNGLLSVHESIARKLQRELGTPFLERLSTVGQQPKRFNRQSRSIPARTPRDHVRTSSSKGSLPRCSCPC